MTDNLKTRSKRRMRRNRKRQQQLVVAGAVLILLIIFIVKGCSSSSDGSGLEGLWSIDGVTKYQFIDDKNGAMVLSHESFEFTYKLKDGLIYIDFADDNVIDSEYEYVLEGKKLIFKNDAAEYVMKREK